MKAKDKEIIADNLKETRLELGLECQPLIPIGARSGLLTRIATTESGWVVRSDDIQTAFLELESAIRASSQFH